MSIKCKAWTQGCLFKPYFDDVTTRYLEPKRNLEAISGKKTCDPDFEEVSREFAKGESAGEHPFSFKKLLEQSWEPKQYLACFLYWVTHNNMYGYGGVFCRRLSSVDRVDCQWAIWQAYLYQSALFVKAQEKKELRDGALSANVGTPV